MKFLFDFIFRRTKKTSNSSADSNVIQNKTKRRSSLQTKATSKEEWRPAPEFENLYEVSSLGNIRSVNRYVVTHHNVKRSLRGKRKATFNVNGHVLVGLCKNGKTYNRLVRNLVAGAFVPQPSDANKFYEVQFIDGNPNNLNASNLKYEIMSEAARRKNHKGMTYKKVSSRMKVQKKNSNKNKISKISKSEERLVAELRKVGYTYRQIAKTTGRSESTIKRVLKKNNLGGSNNDTPPFEFRII